MPQYILVYLGGKPPATPEEGRKHFAKYKKWLSSLGEAAVSPANPFQNTHTVRPDGTVAPGSTTAMSGFTIVEADSLQAALEMARTCPFLEVGGSIEVSEMIQMAG